MYPEFHGILDLSKQHTDVEVIDAATQFLVKQARQSVIREHCKYRGDGDTKCAVGAFIPDSYYHPHMEFVSVDDLLFEKLVDPASQLGLFFDKHKDVLDELQFVHDSVRVEHWEKYLIQMRNKYSTTASSIDSTL